MKYIDMKIPIKDYKIDFVFSTKDNLSYNKSLWLFSCSCLYNNRHIFKHIPHYDTSSKKWWFDEKYIIDNIDNNTICNHIKKCFAAKNYICNYKSSNNYNLNKYLFDKYLLNISHTTLYNIVSELQPSSNHIYLQDIRNRNAIGRYSFREKIYHYPCCYEDKTWKCDCSFDNNCQHITKAIKLTNKILNTRILGISLAIKYLNQ